MSQTKEEMKIVKARITAMPKSFFDPMPTIYGTTEDGVEHELFNYYPDELSFRAEEFIGLSLSKARNLKFVKDRDFLRS